MAAGYELIIHHLSEEFGVDVVGMSPLTALRELELDSLSLAELAVILQEETGIRVQEIDENSTLGELARQIDGTRVEAPGGSAR
jgi:acyl carrier protein